MVWGALVVVPRDRSRVASRRAADQRSGAPIPLINGAAVAGLETVNRQTFPGLGALLRTTESRSGGPACFVPTRGRPTTKPHGDRGALQPVPARRLALPSFSLEFSAANRSATSPSSSASAIPQLSADRLIATARSETNQLLIEHRLRHRLWLVAFSLRHDMKVPAPTPAHTRGGLASRLRRRRPVRFRPSLIPCFIAARQLTLPGGCCPSADD